MPCLLLASFFQRFLENGNGKVLKQPLDFFQDQDRRKKVGLGSQNMNRIPPFLWKILWGMCFIESIGCTGRAVPPQPAEQPLFGPAVMKLDQLPLQEGREFGRFRPEIPEGIWQEESATPEVRGKNYYYLVTVRECRALAAAHAVWANILDEESELAAAAVGRGRSPRARTAALQSDLLRYAALAERNRAVAQALELFYRLAEAEALWDVTEAALQQIEKARQDSPGGKSAGGLEQSKPSQEAPAREEKTSCPAEQFSLAQEAASWHRRQEELEEEIESINSQLRPLLGAGLGEFRRIWPAVPLTINPEKPDLHKLVQRGLEERPELRALRRLLRGIDAHDLTAVRRALEQWHPALGATPSRFPGVTRWLGTPPQHMEAATRQEQLRFLLARREKEVEEQIRQRAHELEKALQQFAKVHAAYHRAVEKAGRKSSETFPAAGQSPSLQTVEDIRVLLALYKAQAELTRHLIAYKIAEIKLWEAIGTLAQETGYPLPEEAWQGVELD